MVGLVLVFSIAVIVVPIIFLAYRVGTPGYGIEVVNRCEGPVAIRIEALRPPFEEGIVVSGGPLDPEELYNNFRRVNPGEVTSVAVSGNPRLPAYAGALVGVAGPESGLYFIAPIDVELDPDGRYVNTGDAIEVAGEHCPVEVR